MKGKGHNGYINQRKKILLTEVLVLCAGIIGLIVTGVIATGTRKNLLTVAAIVSVLPMTKQLVILIALWKYKSRPLKEYQKVKEAAGNGVVDTELVITSKTEKTIMVDYACVHESGIICYCSDRNMASKKSAEYIKGFIRANGLNLDVFIMHEWKQYLKRIKSLEPWDRNTCDEKLLRAEGVIRGLSI